MERICVTSLREAFLDLSPLDELPGVTPHVVVGRVEVDHAAALVGLLYSRMNVWSLDNLKRLKRVAIADRLLTIAGSAILPILIDSPFDESARKELRRYAFRVVGGSFDTEARDLADRLLNHANQVGKVPLLSLIRNAQDVRKTVLKFRRSRFALSPESDLDLDDEDFVGWHGPRDDYYAPPTGAPIVRVTSLRQLMEAVLEAAGEPRHIIVASVHVRHSEALREVLLYQALRCSWSVVNGARVKLFTSVDRLLLTISVAILPELRANPTDQPCGDILCRHADEIKAQSEGVGGSFNTEVTALADRLLSHAYDMGLHPLVTAAWLAGNVRKLIAEIVNFRSRQVTLSEEA